MANCVQLVEIRKADDIRRDDGETQRATGSGMPEVIGSHKYGVDNEAVDIDCHDTTLQHNSAGCPIEQRPDDDASTKRVSPPGDQRDGRIERIQSALHNFAQRHGGRLKTGAYVAAISVYVAYFVLAIRHEFGSEDSIRLVWMTSLAAILGIGRLAKSRCGGRSSSRMCVGGGWIQRHRLALQRTLVGIAVSGIVVFLVLDVAMKRPSNLRSLLGIVVFIFLLFVTSVSPSTVRWRPVLWGLGLQFGFALLVLRTDWGFAVFAWLGDRVKEFLAHADAGSVFVFGEKYLDHPFAMQVIPVAIFFSTVISVLYYLGVMEAVILRIAWVMNRTLGTSVAESVNAAGNIFIGQTEAPLLIRPLIPRMSTSELHAVMVGGYATIAGSVMATYVLFGVPANHLICASVMAAPCALGMAKLSFPSATGDAPSTDKITKLEPSPQRGVVEAASAGASIAIKLVSNMAANLIAFIALLRFVNATLTWFGRRVGMTSPYGPELTFQLICSYALWPFAFAMGVASADCRKVGELIGVKVFLNEFVAYSELGKLINNTRTLAAYNGSWQRRYDDILLAETNVTLVGGVLQERTVAIATYALCGFANISSIGMVMGSLGSMAGHRKPEVAAYAVRAMIVGNVVCFLNACTAGLLHPSV